MTTVSKYGQKKFQQPRMKRRDLNKFQRHGVGKRKIEKNNNLVGAKTKKIQVSFYFSGRINTIMPGLTSHLLANTDSIVHGQKKIAILREPKVLPEDKERMENLYTKRDEWAKGYTILFCCYS